MRHLALLLAAAGLSPHAALADACRDEIAAMLVPGGPLDSFALPPHWRQIETFDAEGRLVRVYDNIVETPVRQIGGIRGSGSFLLSIGADTWSGPAPEGPWTAAGRMEIGDAEAAQRAVVTSMARNLSETECPGEVQAGGRTLVEYRFRARVDPDPDRGESWWTTKDRVWLDPATRLPAFWENTAMQASWAPAVSTERQMISYAYDPAYRIPTPP